MNDEDNYIQASYAQKCNAAFKGLQPDCLACLPTYCISKGSILRNKAHKLRVTVSSKANIGGKLCKGNKKEEFTKYVCTRSNIW